MARRWIPEDISAVVPLRSRGRTRWIARILGLLIAVFALTMGIGSGVTEGFSLTAVGGGVFGFVVWITASMLMVWRWEKLGGLSCVLAGVGLGIFVAVTAGRNNAVVALAMGLPIIAIGVAFLIASRQRLMPRRVAEG